MRDVGLHAQKRGWARGVTWIAGRRRWSRYGESPRRRNVRDVKTTALGCPGGPCGLWLYRGEFCVIKEPKYKIVFVIPQQIQATRYILGARPGFAVGLLCSKWLNLYLCHGLRVNFYYKIVPKTRAIVMHHIVFNV